jgi:GH24 family phage-related lysozyme (muramidase)
MTDETLKEKLDKLPAFLHFGGVRMALYIYHDDAGKWRIGYGKWGNVLIHASSNKKETLEEAVDECLPWVKKIIDLAQHV